MNPTVTAGIGSQCNTSQAQFLTIYPLARRAAQVRASAKVANGSLPRRDREDLEQEGLLACWRALPRFDPNRASLPTFLDRVAANRLSSVVRFSRTPVMLALNTAEVGTVGFGLRKTHLEIDVARAIQRLNDNDRRLAVALMEYTPTEASRAFRISRSTVYEGIRRIRTVFEDAGLRVRGGTK